MRDLADQTPPDDQTAPYDDRPIAEDGALPPEVYAPLAALNGEPPPSPGWFRDAVAQEPQRSFVESLGTKIELLSWGEVGRPGVLLVHGNGAHADWWSFIAPFLAQGRRVAAMSLAGMGASDWRDRYGFDDFCADAEACAQAAGLYASGSPPVYVGHSFGGSQVFYAASRHPDRMRAAILVDTVFASPPPKDGEGVPSNLPTGERGNRVYPTVKAALARFRLMPPQRAGEIYAADLIARRSLKQAPLPDGSGAGWTWKFDPRMWARMDPGAFPSLRAIQASDVRTPMAHVYGMNSPMVLKTLDRARRKMPPGAIEVVIPGSDHHIMVDQPLALVAALGALLAAWPA